MFSWISGRLRCFSGKHQRSQKHIRKCEGDQYVSRCAYCRKPMKRRAKRDWLAISRREFKAQMRSASRA